MIKQTMQPDIRFADVSLATGVRLRYAEWGDPAGQAVIMLHGYTDSWFSFSRLLPFFDSRRRVFVLDQRGHGDSDRPAGGYTFPDLAGDVIAFLDAKGISSATLIGHSMGSLVAQQTALTAPERVDRIVLIGSTTTVRNDATVAFLEEVVKLVDPVPEEFAREFQLSTIHRPLPVEFVDRIVAESLKLPARVWFEMAKGMLAGDCREELGRIQAPALILWGDRDAYFPRSEQDALASALPNAVLRVYPETGHSPHWERPEEVAREIIDFISE
ncbi:MAG: alpha/beta hydrolase [Acidobacteriota bacterium]|nr:MAG: alpha/beta hydrolase [Acidobacteriota bacterium]